MKLETVPFAEGDADLIEARIDAAADAIVPLRGRGGWICAPKDHRAGAFV